MNFFSKKIKKIEAHSIFDSRGEPTIECSLHLSSGEYVTTSIPTGASTDLYENLPLYDNDPHVFQGKGVSKAIDILTTHVQKACYNQPVNLSKIDTLLKQIAHDLNITGSNWMLAVSLATLKAAALIENLPLYKYIANETETNNNTIPRIIANVINGGYHAHNGITIQEFCLITEQHTFSRKPLYAIIESYQRLKQLLHAQKISLATGDEGGFAAFCSKQTTETLLKLLQSIIAQEKTTSLFLGIDAAASTFFNRAEKTYTLDNKTISPEDLTHFYESLLQRFPINMIEDPYATEDRKSWKSIVEKNPKALIVGDDLFASHETELIRGITQKLATGIIIKPNQVGTMSDIFKTIKCAKQNNVAIIVSHRSGETLDTSIVDLAVGINAWGIKIGAPTRGERIAKYNRFLEIIREHE